MNVRVRRVLVLGCVGAAAVAVPAIPVAAGGGCHRQAGDWSQPVAGNEVAMEHMCFTPGVLEVEPGTKVRFFNKDSVPHVVLGTGWGTADEMVGDDVFEHTFASPGTYPYSCYLHPTMNGAIVVSQAGAPSAPASPPVDLVRASAPAPDDGLETASLGLGALAGALAALGTTRRLRRRS